MKGKPRVRAKVSRPSQSVCRDCGHRAVIPRFEFFKAARPRCIRCGATLEYKGSWAGTRARSTGA